MEERVISINGQNVLFRSVQTVIVGSGASGYNTAFRLAQHGQANIALVTENVNRGTSRNAGSDKQTYYKLTQAGARLDSVEKVAQALVSGGCVDGDQALCEAALSTRCFYNLVELGVPFPNTRYGEYLGYKTDHDPCDRGSSSGPYTSKHMTMALEAAVKQQGTPIFSGLQCISILKKEGNCCGILCVSLDEKETCRYVCFLSANVVFATGGPAGMYADSVYPHSQLGATGVAFEAGVAGKNLTEWQFGLASISPRWNVSGTYMQVVPQFISTNPDGSDAREFLWDALNEREIWEKVFLKGYQWPFDVNKIYTGSSIIDILVYIETQVKGRRVFLDFRQNPRGRLPEPEELSDSCREYLQAAGALFGTPIERLAAMNQPAINYYLENGVDLYKERLEIALCVQHNNGGLGTNLWWETELPGFFAVGEACGSHGVYRPGGSALNAGQVGALRAAQYIIRQNKASPSLPDEKLDPELREQIVFQLSIGRACLGSESNVEEIWEKAARGMSLCASIIRKEDALASQRDEARRLWEHFTECVSISQENQLPRLFQLRGMLLSQYLYLAAMHNYAETVGLSRGSAICSLPEGGEKPFAYLPDDFCFQLDRGRNNGRIQEIRLREDDTFDITWRAVRPIPQEEMVFETVWTHYREDENIF